MVLTTGQQSHFRGRGMIIAVNLTALHHAQEKPDLEEHPEREP